MLRDFGTLSVGTLVGMLLAEDFDGGGSVTIHQWLREEIAPENGGVFTDEEYEAVESAYEALADWLTKRLMEV